MPHNKKRYDKFLTGYEFFKNSIDFRIHSSKGLEKWKNVQAFQLNQLVNGRFYFNQPQREILLLNYDLWSKWLYELENLCIEVSGIKARDIVNTSDVKFIISLTERTNEKIDEIIAGNSESFDAKFIEVWSAQHANVREYMICKLRSFSGNTVKQLFQESVNLITDVMQHTLIEIYEIENLFSCKELASADVPFLCVNDFNEKVFTKFGTCLISSRLKIYKEYFDIPEVRLKNYTVEPIPYDIADRIEALGIKINYKLTSRFDFPK